MNWFDPGDRTHGWKAIGVGAVVLLGGSVLSIALLGLADAVVPILAAAVLGGFVAGWTGFDPTSISSERLAGGKSGVLAAGIGGGVLVGALLALNQPATVAGGGASILLVASPLALPSFAVLGFVGGYAGVSFRLASSNGDPEP